MIRSIAIHCQNGKVDEFVGNVRLVRIATIQERSQEYNMPVVVKDSLTVEKT